MKNNELFERTVGILADAYKNGELTRGSCHACAVGNLVCGNMYNGDRAAWLQENRVWGASWADVFMTGPKVINMEGERIEVEQNMWIERYEGKAKAEIDSTGYSVKDLASIEYAFESASEEGDEELNGLYAVYERLCEIHELDLQSVTSPVEVFVK